MLGPVAQVARARP